MWLVPVLSIAACAYLMINLSYATKVIFTGSAARDHHVLARRKFKGG